MEEVIITRKRGIGFNTIELTLRAKQRFIYEAGQYLTLELKIGGEKVQRCYSLASIPEKGGGSDFEIKLAIKKVGDGRMSSFIVDMLEEGTEARIGRARGSFISGIRNGKQVFFAAGSGIAPNFSLIQAGLAAGKKMQLFYLNRDKRSIIYREELEAFERKHGELFRCHFITNTIASFEFLYKMTKKIYLGEADEYFICGPEKMMDNTKAALEYSGVGAEKIKIEYFQLENKSGVPLVQSGESFNLEVRGNKRSEAIVMAAKETLLEALLRGKIEIPYSCKNGICGTCIAKKVDGEIFSLKSETLTAEEKQAGYCLTCISYPISKKVSIEI